MQKQHREQVKLTRHPGKSTVCGSPSLALAIAPLSTSPHNPTKISSPGMSNKAFSGAQSSRHCPLGVALALRTGGAYKERSPGNATGTRRKKPGSDIKEGKATKTRPETEQERQPAQQRPTALYPTQQKDVLFVKRFVLSLGSSLETPHDALLM